MKIEGFRMDCFIFDIDGTLADCSHRQHHVERKPKDWDAFFTGMADDRPHRHVFAVMDALFRDGETIVYCSGRPERYRRLTAEWLEKHACSGQTDNLYMRKDGDYRADFIVKAELLAQIRADGFNPVMAFDDRQQVVDMWRDNGVPCAQVAKGDF
jgi:hypothetical protein